MKNNMKLVTYFILLAFISTCFLASCTRCSRSGRRYEQMKNQKKETLHNSVTNKSNIERDLKPNKTKTIIKMTRENGIYKIPVEINDVNMFFIFDTGASLISISEAEVIFLVKQNKLSEDDVLGQSKFIDAIGNISEGTIINLKKVKIGDKVLYNIKASVVHNINAPLLFGQSALEKFGKISIDYKNEKLILE